MGAVKRPERRTYGGRTADERRARRREALIEAAFALVAEEGWRQLTIEVLCRRAGLNKRYFYEAFDSLDAVVAAVTAKVAGDAIAVTLDAISPGGSRAEAVREGVTAFVEHLTDDPRRARVLFGAVPAADAAAGHRAVALRQVIATAGARGRTLFALGDDPATEVAAAMVVGGSSQVLLDWLDGRIACSRDELVGDLVAMWLVLGDTAAARARGRRR